MKNIYLKKCNVHVKFLTLCLFFISNVLFILSSLFYGQGITLEGCHSVNKFLAFTFIFITLNNLLQPEWLFTWS